MQIDFHHAVTYIVARLAGFENGLARALQGAGMTYLSATGLSGADFTYSTVVFPGDTVTRTWPALPRNTPCR